MAAKAAGENRRHVTRSASAPAVGHRRGQRQLGLVQKCCGWDSVISAFGQLVTALCGKGIEQSAGASQKPEGPSEPRRWYKVHPAGDLTWHVRRDMGPPEHASEDWQEIHEAAGVPWDTGQDTLPKYDLSHEEVRKHLLGQSFAIPRASTSGLEKAFLPFRQRLGTLPRLVERRIGMKEPEGFDRSAFDNSCRVCFEHPADLILVPCCHGGLCEQCFRATLYSRPSHRGGRSCPFCRKHIWEALELYHESSCAPQYAYAIEMK